MVTKTIKKILGVDKKKTSQTDTNIDEIIKSIGAEESGLADTSTIYVKSILLKDDESIREIQEELDKGNIIVLNVGPMLNNKPLLKDMIDELKSIYVERSGDMARLSEEKVLLVPAGIRIIHREEQEEQGKKR